MGRSVNEKEMNRVALNAKHGNVCVCRVWNDKANGERNTLTTKMIIYFSITRKFMNELSKLRWALQRAGKNCLAR